MASLLFIYKAKSGVTNALLDSVHKMFSPRTYPCQLCTLTHNTFSENKLWKTFKNKSQISMTFYHTDEFLRTYPNATYTFPVILCKTNDDLSIFISTSKLSSINTTEALITLIQQKLQ